MYAPGFCYYSCMRYVALLRGINVGGNNKVPMKELKECFEHAGFDQVKTYINSGNIVFEGDLTKPTEEIADILEKEIKEKFGFEIHALVYTSDNFLNIARALPGSWSNDEKMKCDVLFLWKEVNEPDVIDRLMVKPDVDETKYVPGAVLWMVDRKNVTKSGQMKLSGTEIYKKMTIRNCNTVRKLSDLVQDL